MEGVFYLRDVMKTNLKKKYYLTGNESNHLQIMLEKLDTKSYYFDEVIMLAKKHFEKLYCKLIKLNPPNEAELTQIKNNLLSHFILQVIDLLLLDSLFLSYLDKRNGPFDSVLKTTFEGLIKNQLLISEILVSGFEKTNKNLTTLYETEIDKRRTFPKKLMLEIKKIEQGERDKRSSMKQLEMVVEANKILKLYRESELLDSTGNYTQFCLSIRDSYKSQKKSL